MALALIDLKNLGPGYYSLLKLPPPPKQNVCCFFGLERRALRPPSAERVALAHDSCDERHKQVYMSSVKSVPMNHVRVKGFAVHVGQMQFVLLYGGGHGRNLDAIRQKLLNASAWPHIVILASLAKLTIGARLDRNERPEVEHRADPTGDELEPGASITH